MSAAARAFAGAEWFDLQPRSAVLGGLSPLVLLHAGPPLRATPPNPVRNAAIQALLFERIANTPQTARRMLEDGTARLAPAQDYGVVAPLAQVVSASMPVAAVRQNGALAFGALVEGAAPALRFGSGEPECWRRLAELRVWLEREIAPRVRRAPIELGAVIASGLAAGDECHAQTTATQAALISCIADLPAASALHGVPAFVLPIIMAAAALALRTHAAALTAIGGNGIEFGIKRRGETRWRSEPARPPEGTRLPGCASAPALPAIGDSMLIDFCGLGAQAFAPAAERSILDPRTGIVDPHRIALCGIAPRFNLAILDAAGAGLIGRGTFSPPTHLFVT